MASPQLPILLTGTTGGLGAKILHDLLHIHSIPPSSIIATSRNPSNRSLYESQGVQFRVADYNDPSMLESAFQGVGELLFMSSSERDNDKRNFEHGNVIAAAKQANVGRVWYVSLAFGGWGDGSKIGFQQAHYATEDKLKESGLNFLTLRAGIYTDAFPLFLNWYPSTHLIPLPNTTPPLSQSRIAFTTRADIGAGIAVLLTHGLDTPRGRIVPTGEKNIILLSGPKAESLVDLVGAINRGRGRGHVNGPGNGDETDVQVEYLDPESWIEKCASHDEGGKGRGWFEARLVFMQGIVSGDAETVDPALEVLLGGKPETGTEGVERLVREAGEGGYTWHQNYAR